MSKNKIFWAIFFIGMGVMLLVSAVMEWNPKVFPLGAGILAIALGVVVMLPTREKEDSGPFTRGPFSSGSGSEKDSTHTFSDNTVHIKNPRRQYTTAFARTVYDLRDIEIMENTEISITVSFAEGLIRLNPEQAVEIECSTAFGETLIPGTQTTPFGSGSWKSEAADKGGPVLKIRLHTVFGQCRVEI